MQKNVLLNLLDSIIESVFTIKDYLKQSELDRQKIVAVDFGAKKGQSLAVVEKEQNNDMIKHKDANIRKRETPSGTYYEVRYRRNGYSKSFMSKIKKEALEKFATWAKVENEKLMRLHGCTKRSVNKITFGAFSLEALELKKPLIKSTSFRTYTRILKNHLLPAFEFLPINEIKSVDIQKLVNRLYEEGKTRVLEDVKVVSLFIFDQAVKNEIIPKNPVKLVNFPKHYRRNGTALSIQEELKLVERIKGSHFEPAVLFMLYSGCRRAEVVQLTHANFDLEKNTVMIPCAKVKGRKEQVFREIPLFPYLRQVVERFWDNEKAYNVNVSRLTDSVNKATDGAHTLHELRHTFISRAKECGVHPELVATWAGHDFEGVKRGKITATVYTHFSLEFQFSEAKKLNYLDKI